MRSKKVLAVAVAIGLVFVAAPAEASHPGKQEGTRQGKAQRSEHRMDRRAKMAKDGCGGRPKAGAKHGRKDAKAKRLVHSEAIVQAEDGFVTHLTDRGKVTSVKGNTVTIERADGKSVNATASEDTRVCRDGKAAKVSDLKTSDQAGIIQLQKGGATTVKAVMAHSGG